MSDLTMVAVFAYTLGKSAEDVQAAIAKEIEAGEKAEWPAFRSLARMPPPLVVQVYTGALIARARSTALGSFLAMRGANRFVMIDDDVDARLEDSVLLWDATMTKGTCGPSFEPRVVTTPMALRGSKPARLNVTVRGGPTLRELEGVRVFGIEAGGLAYASMTRTAAERLAASYPELRFREGVGVFLEQVTLGEWVGEDAAFCARCRESGVRLYALCDTIVTHAGVAAVVAPNFFRSEREGS